MSSALTTRSYSLSVVSGNKYKFKIQARNAIGYSVDSAILQVIAGIKPDQPDPPTTSVSVNNVLVVWEAPSLNSLADYGSALIAY